MMLSEAEQAEKEYQEKKAKNREYQRKYREKAKFYSLDKYGRIQHKDRELRRINTLVSLDVFYSLENVAEELKMTKKAVLEMLIMREYSRLFE